MTHEQADEIILLLRACHGALADIADAIRAHEAAKPAPGRKPTPSRRRRPDPPLAGEASSEPAGAGKPEGETP
jgi:hypothetical protein